MTTIKGPIEISTKNMKKLIEDANKAGAKIKLPFKATGFTSSKSPLKKEALDKAIKEDTPKKTEKPKKTGKKEEPKKTAKDKMLDNYLDQNARTVIKALQEDDFDDDTLEDLLELEKTDKDRKTVKEAIEAMIGD